MKNMLTLIVLLSSWLTVYSQESYTEAELKQKCDSIVEEANTLYRYETAAWNFTDMIFAKPGLIETIQNILTYHQGDSIKCVAIDKQSYCIYEATFLNESAPCSEVTIIRKSKFPWFPERSVQFSGKRTKRSVQKKGYTQHL